MYHMDWFPSGGGWWIGMLVFTAFVVLIVLGIVWILRGETRYRGAPPPPVVPPVPSPRSDSALQILRERFAPNPASVPAIEVKFVALSTYDELAAVCADNQTSKLEVVA